MVKAQRPSKRLCLSRVGAKRLRSAQHIVLGVMIWSDLVGNYKRLAESASRNIVQNIPRPMTDPTETRRSFIATPGCRLIVADYEQLEMRLMANASGDPDMVQAILDGKDIHSFTASRMFGYDYDEFITLLKAAKKHDKEGCSTPEDLLIIKLRQASKVIGFGIIYGMGPNKLMESLAEDENYKTLAECKDLIEQYFDSFSTVRDFVDYTKYMAAKVGYVITILGRRRRLIDVKSTDFGKRSEAERQATNYVIQGSAADVATLAMLMCSRDPELKAMHVDMLLQIHDELVFEVPDNDNIVNRAKEIIKHHMEHTFSAPLKVPLPVSINDGFSWLAAK